MHFSFRGLSELKLRPGEITLTCMWLLSTETHEKWILAPVFLRRAGGVCVDKTQFEQ